MNKQPDMDGPLSDTAWREVPSAASASSLSLPNVPYSPFATHRCGKACGCFARSSQGGPMSRTLVLAESCPYARVQAEWRFLKIR